MIVSFWDRNAVSPLMEYPSIGSGRFNPGATVIQKARLKTTKYKKNELRTEAVHTSIDVLSGYHLELI